jgi:Immunoglobulin I-set domain.
MNVMIRDAVLFVNVLLQVEWLKNDEPLRLDMPHKYKIIGNGTELQLHKIAYADTGAYMCQASNVGGVTRDISSLVVQEDPTPSESALFILEVLKDDEVLRNSCLKK